MANSAIPVNILVYNGSGWLMISRGNSSIFPTKFKTKEWVKSVCIARKQCFLDLGKNSRHRNDFALCRTFYSSRFLMGKRDCWTINITSSLSCISYPVIPFQIKDLFKGYCSSSFFTAWKWCCFIFFKKTIFQRDVLNNRNNGNGKQLLLHICGVLFNGVYRR